MAARTTYRFQLLLAGALAVILGSCSLTRTIPEGEYLYTGSSLEVEAPDTVSTKALYRELESLLRPRTNRKILGIPFRLGLYNFFATGKEKGFFPWLQRILGEEPILFDEDYIEPLEELLANRSFNRGFFDPRVRAQVDSSKKKAHILYQVELYIPYTITYYHREIADSTIARLVDRLDPDDILETGKRYNLEDLKAELDRIEDLLRDEGYFYFSSDYLQFRGDSTLADHQIGLTLTLKEDVPEEALRPAYVGSIHIYPSYRQTGGIAPGRGGQDSVVFHGDQLAVRNRVILRSIIFRPGDRYNADYHRRTQQRLINLPYYRFANVRFRAEGEADSLLRMDVFLSPNLQHTVEGYLGVAHKSTHFIGPEVNLTYLNRNIFGGSELLRIAGDANFNFPLRRAQQQYYEEIELNGRLTRPGLLVPFLNERSRKRLLRAGTNFEVSFKRQRASVRLIPEELSEFTPLFVAFFREKGLESIPDRLEQDSAYAPVVAINEPEFKFGYQWGINKTITHFLNPFRLRLQIPTFQEEEFERYVAILIEGDSLVGPGYLNTLIGIQRMLIYQPEYIFVFDGRLAAIRRHNFFYRGRISFAGNNVIESTIPELNASNYQSRFLQLENDFRYFLHLPRNHVLAFRWITNFSIPLGRELILPFFDLYSVGGPNSLRAFGTREVGPGTVEPREVAANDITRGKGDIKIEGSLEFRHRLSRMFELGYFIDAGNVWLLQGGVENLEEQKFDITDFYREMAVGTGLGFRVLFSGLVVRLDFGMPLRKPWYPEGERWLPEGIRLGDPSWRKDNIVWNLAFGYPF